MIFEKLAFFTALISSMAAIDFTSAIICVFSEDDKKAAHIPNVPCEIITCLHMESRAKSVPLLIFLDIKPSIASEIVPT